MSTPRSSPGGEKGDRSKLLCNLFSRGSCKFGTRCRFSHDLSSPSPSPRTPDRPKRPCNTFHRTGRCRYGNDCRFSHAPETPSEKTARLEAEKVPRRADWSRRLGNPDYLLPTQVAKLTADGLEIISSGDGDAKQSLIKNLGEQRGLEWIRELLSKSYDVAANQYTLSFQSHCVPFLQLISHEEVLSSLVLEKAVGTIYNVVYGHGGQRAIDFFEKAVANLQKSITDVAGYSSDLEEEREKNEQAALAITATLYSTINLNHEAQVQKEFRGLATTLGEILSSSFFPVDRLKGHELRSASQYLQRIRHRLQMGDSIPHADYTVAAAPVPAFQLTVDLPGEHSVKGVRHDNDHASIENISILPTTDEIKSDRAEFLPLKDRAASHHERGIYRLLDSQFRLLREDSAGQLRDAVCQLTQRWEFLIEGNDQNLKRKMLRQIDAKISLFDNIVVERLRFDRRKGMVVDVSFTQPKQVLGNDDYRKRAAWWTESRDLQYGGLVALVNHGQETSFLTVADRVVEQDRKADNDDDLFPELRKAELRDLSGNENRAMISLKLVDPRSIHDQARIRALAQEQHSSGAVLIEFPGMLFVSFEPILKCLQALHERPNLPFINWIAPDQGAEYVTNGELVEVPPPLYMTRRDGRQLDLSCITTDKHPLRFSTQRPVTVEELEKHTTLDRGQCESLIMSLQHELALVQGPPGTGKSYIGLQLVKVLLANREMLKLGPIVCVCYTNHALDQFLEHILDQGENSIIRLGSRSKSERLQDRTLAAISSGMRRTKVEGTNIWKAKQQIEDIEEDMNMLLAVNSRPCTDVEIASYVEEHFPQQHDNLFADAKDAGGGMDSEGFITVRTKTRSDILKMWMRGARRRGDLAPLPRTERSLRNLLTTHDMWRTSVKERQRLKAHWGDLVSEDRGRQMQGCLSEFTAAEQTLRAQYQESDKRCLEQAHVIGVTTTGLATNSELLRSLPAKVLVCEEAAEVLEAHLITALLPSVEHAILIGDHLQLRAQISKYELSMESTQGRKYGLDESLFERLANERYSGARMPIAQLDVQRRMHPSIASLVRNTLYPGLLDHKDTEKLPEVTGMKRRLFWLDHKNREDSSAADGLLQTSKSNEWEANMVVSLVRHLSRQGTYSGKSDIAVITPYLGQLRKLRKKFGGIYDLVISDRDMEEIEKTEHGEEEEELEPALKTSQQVKQGRLIDGIRIATVDNFQGEEAKIIIVSLVRSNEEHRCGFLKTSNRINVLLSRAQHGMYVIGDAETSCGIPMWAQVIRMLEEKGNLAPKLELRCSRHPESRLVVEKPEDFREVAPEGGCSEQCKKRLDCGHTCVVKCHSDALHDAVKCQEDCNRQFSHCQHPCPKRCWEDCGKCKVRITTNITLPCGHSPPSLECHETVDLSKVKCREKVTRIIGHCKHQVTLSCYVDIKKYRCEHTCGVNLSCGHSCARKCRECKKKDKDNGDAVIENHGKCVVPCGRSYTTCNHRCIKACHGNEQCEPCDRPCEVRCSHSRCNKMCTEPCPPCAEQCTWSCPHRGYCSMPCAVPCDMIPCAVRCERELECGHQCPSICGEKCPSKDRCHKCAAKDIKDRIVDLLMMSTYAEADIDEDPLIFFSCGHFYTVSTLDGHMGMQDCYVVDEEGNILGPKAFSKTEMKTCPDCRAPLRNIHRYNRMVKGALLDEATKRFMTHAGAHQTTLMENISRYETDFENQVEKFEMEMRAQNGRPVSKTAKIGEYKRTAGAALRLVRKFLDAVAQAEQPYGKVQSMVIAARQRRNAISEFEVDNTVIQHGFALRGCSLQLRINWAILWNFKCLSRRLTEKEVDNEWTQYIRPALNASKMRCIELQEAAENSGFHKQVIEGLIYHAQFMALTLSDPAVEDAAVQAEARRNGNQLLERCEELIKQHATAAYFQEDVEKARKLVNGGTFYSFVSSAEKQEVMEAMSREFRGTGHWYYCERGHPFTVGECGMPMEQARCTECGSPVGGANHTAVAGVRRAADMEMAFGQMGIR